MISEIIIARNGLILAVSLSIVIMSGSGILLIKNNTNQENYFSDKHPVREASKNDKLQIRRLTNNFRDDRK
jgi:predicted RND superfamily exporter protein